MDQKIMEVRIKQWISLIAEQANSGLSKNEWCSRNGRACKLTGKGSSV